MNLFIIISNIKFFVILVLISFGVGIKAQDTLSIWVGGNCLPCKERIETTARNTIGVSSAVYNLETHILNITFQDFLFDENELHRSLIAKGHDTNLMKTEDNVYNSMITCNYRNNIEVQSPESVKVYSIWVAGRCEMCKDRIEEAALNVIGVKSAQYNLIENNLTVETKAGFIIDDLHKMMATVGHDTEKMKASDDVYEQLPLCCLYRPTTDTESQLSGFVYTEEGNKKAALIGANIFWSDQSSSTITDKDGAFVIPMPDEKSQLIISYVGFRNDTVDIEKAGHIALILNPAAYLDEIEIKGRKRSSEVSYLSPYKVLNVSKRELTKAACCSLAESFQTTPAVDESFSDAVTGTRTIQMLGLASPYIQITRENIPDIRGLSAIFGLEYTPGPWIEGIQLSQGSGSVINGYESMTGQINIELFKPESEEKLYFNAYANEGGRYESNLIFNTEVSDNVSTAILLHGSQRTRMMDRNKDGFLDMPLSDQLIVSNRWKFYGNNGWTGQAGIKITSNQNEAGQISFFEDGNSDDWSSEIGSERIEIWAKTGVLFNENRTSVGIQLSALTHDLDTRFGLRSYNGNQQSFYSNLILQSLIGEGGSDIKMGATLTHDRFDEEFIGSDYNRSETVPGIFAEYTYMNEEKLTIVGGIRYDKHNNYGGFFTPRAHVRYAPTEKTVFRISAGRGQRTPSIFAENIGALASSRSFIILNNENSLNKPYGLDAEVSWNFGINYQQDFNLAGRRASLGIDYFRTQFTNQIVVDYYQKFNELYFYNLEGDSYSNSIQFLMEIEPLEKLNVRLAYRLNDVKTDYTSAKLENPLIARHRGFVNLAYETPGNITFDYTFNILGSKKIPDTRINPGDNSPAYTMSNAQVSKLWGNKFDLYLGVENLFNYRQENPINSAENPFSDDFDASLVWGPIFGRNVYMGVRYKIFNEK